MQRAREICGKYEKKYVVKMEVLGIRMGTMGVEEANDIILRGVQCFNGLLLALPNFSS